MAVRKPRKKRETPEETQQRRDNLLALLYRIPGIGNPAWGSRQIAYKGETDGLWPKDDANFKKIEDLLVEFRREGLIPWEWICDNTRTITELSVNAHIADGLGEKVERVYLDYWKDMPMQAPFVAIEKDGLVDTVWTACCEFNVPLLSTRGFRSWGYSERVARRIREDGRPCSIFTLFDFDPSGRCAEKNFREALEERVNHPKGTGYQHRVELTFKSLGLHWDQIVSMGLMDATRPTKPGAKNHWPDHGDKSCELDAMSPSQLQRLVRRPLLKLMPKSKLTELEKREEAERDHLRAYLDAYPGYEEDDDDE